MIRTVLWDIDGTLLNFKRSEEVALTDCFRQAGVELTKEQVRQYSAINEKCWKMLEQGLATREEILVRRFVEFLSALGRTGIDPERIKEMYEARLGDVYFFEPGSPDICRRLSGKARQYIVTNGTEHVQRRKLAHSGLGAFMDGVFISQAIGATKPDKAFFDTCAAAIPGYKKEETIIIGDSLSSDMEGGNRAGILCGWYNPQRQPLPADIRIDYDLSSLDEVEAIVTGDGPSGAFR